MLIQINQKTGKINFKMQGLKEFFRIWLVGKNAFLLHEPGLKWYKPVEKYEDRDILVCWRFPFSIFAKLSFILKTKWYNLARWFYQKGFIEKVKGKEKIPLLWFTKIKIQRLKLLKVIKFTAGNRHCLCESTKGIIKKPIEKIPQKLLDAYYKEQKVGVGELSKKGTT